MIVTDEKPEKDQDYRTVRIIFCSKKAEKSAKKPSSTTLYKWYSYYLVGGQEGETLNVIVQDKDIRFHSGLDASDSKWRIFVFITNGKKLIVPHFELDLVFYTENSEGLKFAFKTFFGAGVSMIVTANGGCIVLCLHN